MGQIVPDAVERYLNGLNRLADSVLREIAEDGARQGLPLVDAEVGALLRVLAVSIGASRVLEIGTAIGYSGIWLAGALSAGGMLLTMEMNQDRARIARANFSRAGLADRANVIDGDKGLYVPMLDRLVDILRPGGLLVTDNVLWDGEVVPGFVTEPKREPKDTRAIAEYNERLNANPRLMTATVPLRDGVAISVKRS